MFIAKFNQVSSDKFTPNKHGQMPYIGNVLAGTAVATIVDATIFENAGNQPGQLYLCENGSRQYEGREFATVEIVAPVTALEYIQVRKELGAGKLVARKADVAVEGIAATAPTSADLV
jgi:hypothetical protein